MKSCVTLQEELWSDTETKHGAGITEGKIKVEEEKVVGLKRK